MGNPDASLRSTSPFYLADQLKVPVLLIAGKEDRVAGFEQSNRMKYRLKQLSADVDFLFYDNVGHGQNNWYGERHQFAYIDDFLRQHLKLNLPLGENAKKILGEEYELLADSFYFDSFIEKDYSRAFDYYHRAADNGNARAMFSIGSFYHQGLLVEEDVRKAAEWYEKSSRNGFGNASYRLGEMYRDGYLGRVDDKKVYDMFNTANEQGYELAALEVAKALCLGEGVDKNFELCMSMLKGKRQENDSKKDTKLRARKKEIFGDIFWGNNFSDSENEKMIALLKSEFEVSVVNVDAEVQSYGLYSKEVGFSGSGNLYKHHRTTTTIPLEADSWFGVNIKFLSKQNGIGGSGKTAVKLRWSTLGKNVNADSGSIRESSLIFPMVGEDWNLIYIMNDKDLLQEDDWRLEIYTIDGAKIFEKTFHIKKA